MTHCFYFKIPKDQIQMIILFQWSNKLQGSLLLVTQLTKGCQSFLLSLRKHRVIKGGWEENPYSQ